jgi:hypothetical protein
LFGGYFIEFNGNIRNRLVRLNPLFDWIPMGLKILFFVIT